MNGCASSMLRMTSAMPSGGTAISVLCEPVNQPHSTSGMPFSGSHVTHSFFGQVITQSRYSCVDSRYSWSFVRRSEGAASGSPAALQFSLTSSGIPLILCGANVKLTVSISGKLSFGTLQ